MYSRQFPVQIGAGHMKMPRLDIYYPVLQGMKNTGVQQRINASILNMVNKMVADQEYYQNPRTEITGRYEIKTNERGILSLSLINDAYSGGPHGFTMIRSITANLNNGMIYQLKDLFKPGADYIKRLSSIVAKQISERGIYLLSPFKGIRPDQDYYLTDKSLVIYFQLYELTSYAGGFPQFPIPVYSIRDIADDKGPLNILS